MIELLARFWCRHHKISWPMTLKGRTTTVTCFDCNRTLPYDWGTMRICRVQPQRDAAALGDAEAIEG